MLINATNKHHLTKNETEYLGNLYQIPDESSTAMDITEDKPQFLIDKDCLRKLNLLTAKERPFCAYCSSLTGFSWKTRKAGVSEELPELLCNSCFD